MDIIRPDIRGGDLLVYIHHSSQRYYAPSGQIRIEFYSVHLDFRRHFPSLRFRLILQIIYNIGSLFMEMKSNYALCFRLYFSGIIIQIIHCILILMYPPDAVPNVSDIIRVVYCAL